MTLDQLEDLQKSIHSHLKCIAIKGREKRGILKQEIRLDDAIPEELLEEKVYLETSADWDSIFNLDRDRMIEGSIEVEYEVVDIKNQEMTGSTREAIPVLNYHLRGIDNPPDHIALEFFRQFLMVEADYRFVMATPEMLLMGFKEYIKSDGVKPWLWGYIDDINEFGIKLNDPETGDEIDIDVSDRKKQEIENWERKQQGKPEIKKRKRFEEEDVFDRALRKYKK